MTRDRLPDSAIKASYYLHKAERAIRAKDKAANGHLYQALENIDLAIDEIYDAKKRQGACRLHMKEGRERISLAQVHIGHWTGANQKDSRWNEYMFDWCADMIATGHGIFKRTIESYGYRQPTSEEYTALGDGGNC